jgi:hypothetical protein
VVARRGLGAEDAIAPFGDVEVELENAALMVCSSIQVMIASWPLRSQERSPERNRFFATCWLMVEAPATTFPSRRFLANASWIASQSKPSWSRNFASSATTTARLRWIEIRL